jgi:hypothetical protein
MSEIEIDTPQTASAALEAFDQYCFTLFYVSKEQSYYRLHGERHEGGDKATLTQMKVRAKKAYDDLEPHIETIRQALAQCVPEGYVLVPKDAGQRLGEDFLRALFGPEFDTSYVLRLNTLIETAAKLPKPSWTLPAAPVVKGE